jgi:protein gp37
MNKQFKIVDGKRVSKGIEWCDATWNVIGGCLHECKWEMPDGTVAQCYAKSVAERVAQAHFPQGFAHHYFHPKRLEEPLAEKKPMRIFMDSMSDLFGRWVPAEEIEAVLDTCRRADWHIFQVLTKNPPRLLKFAEKFPPNVWVLTSSSPDWMWGNRLSLHQQAKWVTGALETLAQLPNHLITGMSIEPLSWDIAPVLHEALDRHPTALKWAIVGAASNGSLTYQPDKRHLDAVLQVLDRFNVPIFFKGNLDKGMVSHWREEFPHNDPFRPQPLLTQAAFALEVEHG